MRTLVVPDPFVASNTAVQLVWIDSGVTDPPTERCTSQIPSPSKSQRQLLIWEYGTVDSSAR